MSDIQVIARTVATLASPGMKPKDLLSAVRKEHPDASKKDLSRAAFFAMILASETDPEKAAQAQDLALASRAPDEEGTIPDAPMPELGRRRKKR